MKLLVGSARVRFLFSFALTAAISMEMQHRPLSGIKFTTRDNNVFKLKPRAATGKSLQTSETITTSILKMRQMITTKFTLAIF